MDMEGRARIVYGCEPCARREAEEWRSRNLAWRLLAGARQRAKEAGIRCTLQLSDIEVPDTCPVLGIPLEPGDGVATDSSPSLDRIIPARGYVPGNVVVISRRANQIKSNANPEELRKIADWLQKQMEGAGLWW